MVKKITRSFTDLVRFYFFFPPLPYLSLYEHNVYNVVCRSVQSDRHFPYTDNIFFVIVDDTTVVLGLVSIKLFIQYHIGYLLITCLLKSDVLLLFLMATYFSIFFLNSIIIIFLFCPKRQFELISLILSPVSFILVRKWQITTFLLMKYLLLKDSFITLSKIDQIFSENLHSYRTVVLNLFYLVAHLMPIFFLRHTLSPKKFLRHTNTVSYS